MTWLNIIRPLVLLWLALFLNNSVVAGSIELTVKPKKCVSLHEGQMCYQHVTFQWLSLDEQPLCLFQEGTLEPIYCATSAGNILFTLDVKATSKQQFELRRNDGSVVAVQFIDVVSVYKGRRRATTGWRLF